MAADNNSDDPLVGQTIAGRYRVISRLDAGGMGTAYRAWDERAGVPVVIKMPHKRFLEDPTFAERSIREARVMQGLGHQHIVPVVDVGEHDGLPFLVMRFLPGGSLSNRRLRDEKGKVRQNPPGMLCLWLPAVAEALDFVHASGVVHRDVKPANIFFDALWGAFLGDFGIAKVIAESEVFEKGLTLTGTSMGVGTPEYMAPEQFAPKAVIDGRADQYALAVIAYEMLAGTRPFTGEKENLIIEVMTRPAPLLADHVRGLPSSLVDAVHQGLAKKPSERFATCSQFAVAVLRDVQPIDSEPDVARLLCPKCANLLKLPTSAAGQKGKCPKCKTEMKVAADLGAMWLLDEAKRQEETVGGGWTALGSQATGSGPDSNEQSLEPFRLGSDAPSSGKKVQKVRQEVFAWIDTHGLIVGGVLALAALISWVRPTGQTAARDRAAIQGLQTEKQKLETEKQKLDKQLATAADREKALQQQLDSSKKDMQNLQAELAVLQPTPVTPSPKKPPAGTPPTQGPDLSQLTNSIGMKLRIIPAGTFQMGSNDGGAAERPVHEVKLTKAFYLGIYEVTNAQWKAVMGNVPSKWKEDDRPVESVSWDQAIEFCTKLSERQDEQTAGRVYRLPTEAEWEYACRAGTATRYSFGDNEAALGDHAWFDKNAGEQTHRVGQKKPNPWGLYDMHGNVWEWCSDWDGTYPGDAWTDPKGPPQGFRRALRGGCWRFNISYCRSAYRSRNDPSFRWNDLGFRVALNSSGTINSGSISSSDHPADVSGSARREPPAKRERPQTEIILAREQVKGLVAEHLKLDLDFVTDLPVDSASALVELTLRERIPAITLNGLAALSPQAADALSKLSDDTNAGRWPRRQGVLELNGLVALPGGTAKSLRASGWDLLMDGLSDLPPDSAQELAGSRGRILSLSGIRELSAESAKFLSGFTGGVLRLNGLGTLTPAQAKAIAGFKGRLHLDSLTDLSSDAAKQLAGFRGQALSLNGLTTLSAEQAEAIAGFKVRLHLDSLTDVSSDAAKQLAGYRGEALSLNGLTTLSAEQAEALSGLRSKLWLDGLRHLPQDVASVLAAFRGGELRLNGLQALSAQSTKSLASCKASRLILESLSTLSDEQVMHLAGFQGGVLSVLGPATLTEKHAEYFVRFRGELHLKGPTSLAKGAAKALTPFPGDLYLDGLTRLTVEDALAFADYGGESLYLNNLEQLGKIEQELLQRQPRIRVRGMPPRRY